MAHILVICTANICRSPVATALLRDRLSKRNLSDWTVSSAGTWAQLRRGASHNSILVMAQHGLDINNHLSRMVELPHVAEADLVLCMEVGHAEALRAEFPEHAHKVYMLTEMVDRAYSINDPYGGPYDAYQRMATELIEVIDGGMDQIVALAEANAAAQAAGD